MTMPDQGSAPGSQEMTRSIMEPRGSKAGREQSFHSESAWAFIMRGTTGRRELYLRIHGVLIQTLVLHLTDGRKGLFFNENVSL